MKKINPAKAIYVPMGKRKLPKSKSQPKESGWVPHTQDVALDAWGTAIRVLKSNGQA